MSDDLICSCGHLKLDSEVTTAKNWNPDCQEHGTKSTWYKSPEQMEKRQMQNDQLRELYRLAKAMRGGADHDC